MSEPSQPSTRGRRLLALSLATVLVTLAVIELVVRAVPLYPDRFEVYNPDRGWVYRPNQTGTYITVVCLGEFRSTVTMNSHGLHDVEHSDDKPPDTYRVLFLGDSTVAAFEVPLEQAFYRQLETQLNRAEDRQYQIIGAGFRAYGTDLETIYYEQEGRRYQSDMVILVMTPHNDIHDNHPALRQQASGQYFPYFTLDESSELVFHHPRDFAPPGEPGPPYINPVHHALMEHSRLYRLVYERLELFRTVQNLVEAGGEARPDPQLWEEAWAVTQALVARLRADVEADGAQFAVVIAPGSFRQDPEWGQAIHERLNAMLDEMNIPYLNLASAFEAQEAARGPLNYVCDPHWTAAGHSLAAEELAAWLPGLIEDGTP